MLPLYISSRRTALGSARLACKLASVDGGKQDAKGCRGVVCSGRESKQARTVARRWCTRCLTGLPGRCAPSFWNCQAAHLGGREWPRGSAPMAAWRLRRRQEPTAFKWLVVLVWYCRWTLPHVGQASKSRVLQRGPSRAPGSRMAAARAAWAAGSTVGRRPPANISQRAFCVREI